MTARLTGARVALLPLLALLLATPRCASAAPGEPAPACRTTAEAALLSVRVGALLAGAEHALAPYRSREPFPGGPAFWRTRDALLGELAAGKRARLDALDSAEVLLGSLLRRSPEDREALVALRTILLREHRFEEMDSLDVRLRALGDLEERNRYYDFVRSDTAEAAPEMRRLEVIPIPQTPREVGETLGTEEVLTGRFAPLLRAMEFHLTRRDPAGFSRLLSPTFRGLPLVRAPLPEPTVDGPLLTGRWPADASLRGTSSEGATVEVDAQAFVSALERFLAPVDLVTRCRFYTIGIRADGPDRIAAWVDLEFDGLDARGGRLHDFAKFHLAAAFEPSAAGTAEIRIRGVSDFTGATTARAAREFFVDVSDLAGFGRFADSTHIAGADQDGVRGSALAVGDYDGDGRDDVYIGSHAGSRLHRNLGNGRFEDVTSRAGLTFKGHVASAIFFDSRNRGRQDLFVACYETWTRFFENNGDGTYTDRTEDAGLARRWNSSAVTVADFDRDGFLDLYLGTFADKEEIPPPSRARDSEPDLLFRNQGDGTFSECAEAAGIRNLGRTLDAMACDLDGDGWPDLAVANDFTPSQIYRNLGGFRFRNETARVVDPHVGDAGSVMGLDVADIDSDGRLDLFLSRMSSHSGQRLLENRTFPNLLAKLLWAKSASGSVLFRNAPRIGAPGEATHGLWFDEISGPAGVRDTGWSWGAAFLDFDGNGSEDLLVANGMITGPEERDL